MAAGGGKLRAAFEFLQRGKYLVKCGDCATKPVSAAAADVYRLGENGHILRRNLLKAYTSSLVPAESRGKIITAADSGDCATLAGVAERFALDGGGGDGPVSVVVVAGESAADDDAMTVSIAEDADAEASTRKKRLILSAAPPPITAYTFFDAQSEWKFPYQQHVRARRRWWKGFHFNRSSVSTAEQHATSDTPAAQIRTDFEDRDYALSAPLLLEDSEVLRDDDGGERGGGQVFAGSKVCVSRFYCSAGAVALMLDAVRERFFIDGTRLAVHRSLAPLQVAVKIVGVDGDGGGGDAWQHLQDLRRYIILLLRQQNVIVVEEIDYKMADELAVPYVICLSQKTLVDGVLHVRSRETAWFEEMHVYHVAARFAAIYHGRVVADEDMPPKISNTDAKKKIIEERNSELCKIKKDVKEKTKRPKSEEVTKMERKKVSTDKKIKRKVTIGEKSAPLVRKRKTE